MNAYLTRDPLYRQFRPHVGTHPQLRRRRGYRLLYSSNIVLCVLIHDKCCKAEVCNNECDRFHIVFILFNFFIWEKVTSFLYFFQIILFWLSLFQSCSFCMTFINLSLLILVSQRLRSRKKNTADVIICNEYSATIFFFFFFSSSSFWFINLFYCNFQCQGFSLILH